jgi:glutamate racemase
MKTANLAPIGVMDSGVGGLSVLREIRRLLPQENIVYLADQAHVPYGPRPSSQIIQFSETISRFLLGQGAKIIVLACNTASAAALTHLRAIMPGVLFVGMEPAVKPGAAMTRNGKVGVLATVGTFKSERYAHLTARFAQGVSVVEDPCLGLVELIEAGLIDAPATAVLLHKILTPMLAAGVDTLVLGCTHYPFVMPLIQQIAGPDVTVIDPAPAVARQTERLLRAHNLLADTAVAGSTHLYTTAHPSNLAPLLPHLLGEILPVTAVELETVGSNQ